MKKYRVSLPGLLAVVFAMLFATPFGTFGQTNQGRISGQVTDSSGASVPDASVTIENNSTHVKRVLTTNQDGIYVAPGIEPGVYSVTVEATNFRRSVRSKIQLEVGNDIKADFQLQPGTVTE